MRSPLRLPLRLHLPLKFSWGDIFALHDELKNHSKLTPHAESTRLAESIRNILRESPALACLAWPSWHRPGSLKMWRLKCYRRVEFSRRVFVSCSKGVSACCGGRTYLLIISAPITMQKKTSIINHHPSSSITINHHQSSVINHPSPIIIDH